MAYRKGRFQNLNVAKRAARVPLYLVAQLNVRVVLGVHLGWCVLPVDASKYIIHNNIHYYY